jgi:hypothetical protein
MQANQCFSCDKISWFGAGQDETKCPKCGGAIQLLSGRQVHDGLEAGVYYSIDPKTGKRAKRKKR